MQVGWMDEQASRGHPSGLGKGRRVAGPLVGYQVISEYGGCPAIDSPFQLEDEARLG